MKLINNKLDYSNILSSPQHVYLFTGNPIIKMDGAIVMGAGAAKQVRDTYLGIDVAFGNELKKGIKPIIILKWRMKSIGWFQVKHHWQEEADLDLVSNSARSLTKIAKENPDVTYHLNYPAVGNGKRKVDDIQPLLDGLPDNVHVYLVKPTRRRAAPVGEEIDFNSPQSNLKGKVTIGRKGTNLQNAHNIYCGRGSIFGNPYPMKDESERNEVCDKFEEYFNSELIVKPSVIKELKAMKKSIDEGNNIHLQCFCSPKRCHTETIRNYLTGFDKPQGKSKFRVIIAGGRDFNDYPYLRETLDKILANKLKTHEVEIVCGLAKGADALGDKYAKERNLNVIYKEAQWDFYGKSAGYKRNKEMADIADACIAFWDGKSKGTKHMIDISKNQGLIIRVKKYGT